MDKEYKKATSAKEAKQLAAEWNRCVYEPNREVVKNYKRYYGINEEKMAPEANVIKNGKCKWCYEEVCTNASCPACADFCPVVDYPGVCRLEELEAVAGPE